MLLNQKTIADRLPQKPYCTDTLGYLQVLPKLQAMKKNYLQYNFTNLSTLIYDLDYEVNPYDITTGSTLPAPNLLAYNQNNGHAHAFYILDKPVYQASFNQKKAAAFKYAAYVDKKLTIGLEADRGYGKLLAKSIFNNYWKIFDIHDVNYQLGDLDLNIKIDRRERLDFGLGRNCTVFDTVRHRAYKMRLHETFLNDDFFYYAVLQECHAINSIFETKLQDRELHHIAKSISRWTLRNITPAGFQNWGDNRRKKSLEVRQSKAEEKAQRVREYKAINPKSSIRGIAKKLGYGRDLVHRALSSAL